MEKFSGIFIGTVVDNNDPKKLGRLKINVPTVYGNIKTDDLPWASPSFSYGYHDRGIFFVPEVGALVTVMFLNNSPYTAVWMGAIHREDDNIVPQEIKENYPNRKEIKTKVGYILFDDETNYIQIKHKNGSEIVFSDNGDIVIHAAKDLVLLSDNYILENPSGKTNVTSLPEYKSKNEVDKMNEQEKADYEKQINSYSEATNENCQNSGSSAGGGTTKECQSVSSSVMRQWGMSNRLSMNDSALQNYLKNCRKMSRHTDKANGNNLYFTDELATRLENALDELQMSYPEAYTGFIFTDGFRSSTVTYGATKSRHKFGVAFDWGYKRLECYDLETVYYVLGKHGICCPLSSWNGQDGGMHMELASSKYSGSNPADNLYPKTESV